MDVTSGGAVGTGVGVGVDVGMTRGRTGTGPLSSTGPSTVGVGVGPGGRVKSCARCCCAANGAAIRVSTIAVGYVAGRIIMAA